MRSTPGWLFSPKVDALAFGGTTALALLAVVLGKLLGLWSTPFPLWAWVCVVLAVDVAHVWATLFRVYFDGSEVRRRAALYLLTPCGCYALGVALYAQWGSIGFWRTLAYVAVWHFVRQQLGWLAIYHRLNPATSNADRWLDKGALTASMLYPLWYWHTHTDRAFHWFVDGDFALQIFSDLSQYSAALFRGLNTAVAAFAASVSGLWIARQLLRAGLWLARRHTRAGRDSQPVLGVWLLLTSTAVCWNVGIVVLNNDWAFTWTNVLIHGVPYLVLSWRYARNRYAEDGPERHTQAGDAPREPSLATWIVRTGVFCFFLFLVIVAFGEEWLWDQLVWHERFSQWLGTKTLSMLQSPAYLQWIVPLLAVPQATHYVLDGFVWRGKNNPMLSDQLGLQVCEQPTPYEHPPREAPSLQSEHASDQVAL